MNGGDGCGTPVAVDGQWFFIIPKFMESAFRSPRRNASSHLKAKGGVDVKSQNLRFEMRHGVEERTETCRSDGL